MQVKFTDKAIAHLENILDIFVEYAGERYATKFSERVNKKIERLKCFPEIGFIEPLLKGRKYLYRATIVYDNYKMIYHVEGDTIWIVAFWDMRMDPARLQNMI